MSREEAAVAIVGEIELAQENIAAGADVLHRGNGHWQHHAGGSPGRGV